MVTFREHQWHTALSTTGVSNLEIVQEEMSALTERLDFTEKLLMRGDESADTADER